MRAVRSDKPPVRDPQVAHVLRCSAGTVLWSKRCSTSGYWDNQNTGNDSRDCRDPYGYIDGGQEPGAYYHFCCTSMGFKAAAVALRLMPELQCVWSNDDILVYADRWVNFGVWSRPDPYAPQDSGYYASPFANSMWAAYRSSAPPAPDCTP